MTNCSILIPTSNRPSYLKRILGYYSGYESTYSIIVADGSSDAIKRVNEETISSFNNLSIQHLDKYSSETRLYMRILDALNYVNTKYCVFCADDDFITLNGIKQSVHFLEGNPDFTIAQGYYIGFHLEINKEGNQEFHWNPRYSQESIIFANPEDRLACYLSKPWIPTFYAVHRTDLMRMIFEEAVKFTEDNRFGELLSSSLVFIRGKMKCLDVLYGARENPPETGIATQKTLLDFIRDGTYDKKYREFRGCLSMHLSRQSKLNIKEADKVIDKAMSFYIKRKYLSRDYKRILITKMNEVLSHLNLPNWIDNGVRGLYRKLFPQKNITSYISDFPVSSDISPASRYYPDFNRIRLHVLAHSGIRSSLN